MDRVEYLRKWRSENPDKQIKYNEHVKKYHKANRKRISAKEKEYKHKHPEKILEWDRRYWAKLRKERPWMIWYFNVKSRCKNKCLNYKKQGVKFYLTKEEMKTLWLRDKAYLLDSPSIDRIETTGNYTYDNCRFIELSVNLNRKKGVYHS